MSCTYTVVVGLGNPGADYSKTRHNIGFMVLDRLLEEHSVGGGWQTKFEAEFATIRLAGEKVILVKPQTYMNLSGSSVGEVMRFHQVEVEELLVVHDDIDLPFGTLRLKCGGGHGGHNGVRSIKDRLGSPAFARLKVGVGRPERSGVSDWVLGKFSKEEEADLPAVIDRTGKCVRVACEEGLKAAQSLYN